MRSSPPGGPRNRPAITSYGKQDRRIARHHDGVLEVRSQAAIGRANGPLVSIAHPRTLAPGDDRLHRDHQAFAQTLARTRILIIRHLRLLVNSPAHAMAAEI